MGRRATRITALCGTAVLLACACARTPVTPPVPPAFAPPEVRQPPPCERITRIAVSKRDRRLRASCEGGAVVEMTIALGREDGAKRAAGDTRTPEGRYRISGPPRPSRRFHRFVPIDYPSRADAEIARITGRLPAADYQRILDAHAHRVPPPGDTALGGQLGFHGEGRRWRGDSRDLDWTYGCIGLADADIDFLAERSAIGTPVSIEP